MTSGTRHGCHLKSGSLSCRWVMSGFCSADEGNGLFWNVASALQGARHSPL